MTNCVTHFDFKQATLSLVICIYIYFIWRKVQVFCIHVYRKKLQKLFHMKT